ncbi:APC family permease [soil metagenome]
MAFIDLLIGRPLASREEELQKVGPLAGLPMLGLDGLASAAYGPEAALTILIPLGAAGLAYAIPVIGVIVAILFVLFFSYRQTIAVYPGGGGSYTVARENLGTLAGLIAAAALLLDYVLVVAVGISAGVGALVSAVPSLQPYTLDLGLAILALIALVNLRGMKESGVAFALPTYLFVATLGGVVLLGVVKAILAGGHPVPLSVPPALPRATEAASLWLILRSFASGCTAMTGVEAVSNGVTVFREPKARNAQRTLAAIVGILALLLVGIAYLATAYRIGATRPEGPGYESVVSQLVGAVVGKGVLYYITIGATLAVLALSANTGFADFPRLCRLLAKDDFLPHAFANRARRLVFGRGIAVLTFLSAVLLVAFGGITDRLIPLFAVGAFLAFTLSQAGMVIHWRRVGGSRVSTFVNGAGAVATAVAVVVVLVAKFTEGAWITTLLIPSFVLLFLGVHRHYEGVRRATRLVADIDPRDIRPPLVVVPVKSVDIISAKALCFAFGISPDVHALHVIADDTELLRINVAWENHVVRPLSNAGRPVPELVVASSPFRRLSSPLIEHVEGLLEANPSRTVAVVIPELVEASWWQYLLHNQRATGLKAALLLRGGHRVVVINVPWYMGEE